MRSTFRTSLLLVAGFVLLGASRAAAADHLLEAQGMPAGHTAALHSPQPFLTRSADVDDDMDVAADSERTGKVVASVTPFVTRTVRVLRVTHLWTTFTSDPATCHALLRAPPLPPVPAA